MEDYEEFQNDSHAWPLSSGKFIAVITRDGRLVL